jgi:hypothetical protein
LFDLQPHLPWQNATRNLSPNRIRNAVSALRETLAQMHEDGGGVSFGTCAGCVHSRRLSQRISQCSLMGDRLTGPELKRICRLYAAKAES